jgi:hypothetical protein
MDAANDFRCTAARSGVVILLLNCYIIGQAPVGFSLSGVFAPRKRQDNSSNRIASPA